MKVAADDGHGGTASDAFVLTVTNANDAPTVDQPLVDPRRQSRTSRSPISLQMTLSVTSTSTIRSPTRRPWTTAIPCPPGLSFDPATRTFSGTPTNDDVGAITVKVTADDGNGGTVSDTFALSVEDVNDARDRGQRPPRPSGDGRSGVLLSVRR